MAEAWIIEEAAVFRAVIGKLLETGVKRYERLSDICSGQPQTRG
ncbi:MAG: hypothetical protein O7A06_01365 [Acidobacteria bacterium]|nr:hypothetical protein [Acidobacteriota bacterium]MCZ6752719.1 hypothetical protein [Acidobacteriota bacterium]